MPNRALVQGESIAGRKLDPCNDFHCGRLGLTYARGMPGNHRIHCGVKSLQLFQLAMRLSSHSRSRAFGVMGPASDQRLELKNCWRQWTRDDFHGSTRLCSLLE